MLTLNAPPSQYLAAEKFSHALAPNRSPRYSTVDSGEVLRRFLDAGLMLRTVVPQKLRRKSIEAGRDGLQKHIFRFDTGISLPDNSKLEVLLRNSYDGTAAFGLSLGVFRIVCSNGLVAGTTFMRESVTHSGSNVWDRVSAGIAKVLAQGPKMADTIERWSAKQLTDGRAAGFAMKVAETMLPTGALIHNATSLLGARRTEDAKADLWTTFNRIQENTLAGGLLYRLPTDDESKVRRTRIARGADSVFKTNVALWDLANEVDGEVVAS